VGAAGTAGTSGAGVSAHDPEALRSRPTATMRGNMEEILRETAVRRGS
jgi:hypothetical protein